MAKFTTKVAAEVAGVHQQTVIRWAVSGFLVPSVPTSKYEPRQYTTQDLVALMIARKAIESNFPRQDVAEMVRMTQNDVHEQLTSAALITLKDPEVEEGFTLQLWIPNVKDPKQEKVIKGFVEEGRVLQQVRFSDVVWQIKILIWEKYALDEELDPYLDDDERNIPAIF
jgi:DNA-binding transcriptional MerR regulator